MKQGKPLLIGVVADSKMIGLHPYHCIGDKYIRGITDAMNAVPILMPAIGDMTLLENYLSNVDGILLTGSPSNIEPHHYQGAPAEDPEHDPDRDATTLPLVTMAIEANIPILGICRGFQEINVALGGTLLQKVQETDGMMDHREDKQQSVEIQYGPAHPVNLEPGGLLHQIVGSDTLKVNSIHQQGIEKLANGLNVEARAPDGLVEAFRLDDPERFVLAVQFHPEWKVMENPAYQGIFTAFKAACEART